MRSAKKITAVLLSTLYHNAMKQRQNCRYTHRARSVSFLLFSLSYNNSNLEITRKLINPS